MNTSLYRVYVERKEGFKLEAQRLFTEIKDFVGIKTLEDLRYFNRYDIEGLDARDFKKACMQILGEPQSDNLYFDNLPENAGNRLLAVEYLPGQYDQRADSALQCINLITKGIPALVRCARIYAFKGDLSEKDFEAIKKYIINPVDSREASFQIPKTLKMELSEPGDIPVLSGFSKMTEQEAEAFREMLKEDIGGCCEKLEAITGCKPQMFFWPWGHYTADALDAVSELGLIQFTVAKGTIQAGDNRKVLPRLGVSPRWKKFRKNCFVFRHPLLAAIHDMFHTERVCFDGFRGDSK